jgi:replicative DNA helicase
MDGYNKSDLKLPPHSTEAEQSVLGGLLLDNQAYDRIADKVSEADFYTSNHAIMYAAIVRMLSVNSEVDIVTLAEELESRQQLTKVGGIVYLGELAQNTPTSANIERYAEIVRDRSLKRQMLQITAEISQKIYNPNGLEAKDLLDLAQSKWMAIGENLSREANTMQHVNEVIAGVAEHVDMMFSRDDQSDVTGLHTGITELDSLTSGLQDGNLVIIAARPSMGKTALALNIFEYVCLDKGKNAVFFSFEMPNRDLGLRLVSSVAKLPSQRVRIGRINDNEWNNLTTSFHKLNNVGMYFDDASDLTADDIRARARRLHRKLDGGLSLIVVDYLQLITGNGRENRANEVAEISRKLKKLAKELDVPVVALSQLSRAVESRPNKRPMMSDLRESGGIEQDADVIMFIYRDEVYNPDSIDKGTAEIIVAKQRNGPIGTVRATFINHLTRFENYAHGHEQGGSYGE